MLTQNLCALTLEMESQSQDDGSQCGINALYRNILAKTAKIPVFKRIMTLETKTQSTLQSIGTGKLISRKMRTKLIGWMEKLSLETFNFQMETLSLAIKILDEYLCLTNESPSSLQLIGCACLYLAAKTREVVIVAGQCYVVASAGCFSEEQLIQKELQIFKTLNYNTAFSSLSRVYKFMKQNQISSSLKNFIKKDIDMFFLEISKNVEFLGWREHKIVSMFVALIEAKNQIPKASQILEMLKLYSVL